MSDSEFCVIPESASDERDPQLASAAPTAAATTAATEANHPKSAKEALLQIRLDRLRADLLVDLEDEEPELIDLKITVALEEAVEKFPRYDANKKAFRSVERQARVILTRLGQLLGQPSSTPLKEELGEAQAAHGRWTTTLRPALVASLAAAAVAWYRPCEDPLEAIAENLFEEFDVIEARINSAKDSATPTPSASLSCQSAPKQEARLFDAKTYVPVLFSGTGDPRERSLAATGRGEGRGWMLQSTWRKNAWARPPSFC